MDVLLEKLDVKLREWKPETAQDAKQRVAEIMQVADEDGLDILRSRSREQEVLDLLDEPTIESFAVEPARTSPQPLLKRL